jgi:hypothetical protein
MWEAVFAFHISHGLLRLRQLEEENRKLKHRCWEKSGRPSERSLTHASCSPFLLGVPGISTG